MYATYEQLQGLKGFESLSQDAKDFIKEYCDLSEIRFCDTCGRFVEGDFIWDMRERHRDYCGHECMDRTGYTRKDMLQDFYATPYEGDDGYEEVMKAKEELDEDGFEEWLSSHYDEDPDSLVFWTSDQFPCERNEGAAGEALDWLHSTKLKTE